MCWKNPFLIKCRWGRWKRSCCCFYLWFRSASPTAVHQVFLHFLNFLLQVLLLVSCFSTPSFTWFSYFFTPSFTWFSYFFMPSFTWFSYFFMQSFTWVSYFFYAKFYLIFIIFPASSFCLLWSLTCAR